MRWYRIWNWVARSFTAFIFAIVIPSLCLAANQSRNLHGPEQYFRTGGGTTVYNRTFTVPSYVVGPYQLHLVNGAPSGTNRVAIEDAVSSGRVILNGVEVVSPNDFSKTVATVDKTVSLSATNTLEIHLNSAPDSYFMLTISGTINLADLGSARSGHSATLLSDGKILITGGNGVGSLLSSVEVFNPATLTFSAHPNPLTTPRVEHTATLLPNTEALLVAGRDPQGVSFTAELFDPVNGTFTSLSENLENLRSGHTATVLADGRVLIIGGVDGTQASQGSAEAFDPKAVDLFDPATGTFTSLVHGMNVPRSNHTATLLPDGRILILGGSNNSGILSSGEIFDPTTLLFTPIANAMTTSRSGHTATLLPDGRVLIAGGKNGSGPLPSTELFDPATQTFASQTQSLQMARWNHTATLLPSGEILITGGEGSAGPISHTELYGPPAADTTAPTVLSVSPSNAAEKVYLNAIVAIRFSEPIKVTTLIPTSLTLTGPNGVVSGTVSPVESGLLAFFIPQAKLSSGVSYTITLNGVTDLAGNPLSPFTGTFTTYPAPTISGFSPQQGGPGTTVNLSGENFDADTIANNKVRFFDEIEASISAATATNLTVTVPAGATNGSITVTTPGGEATSTQSFIVALPPSITSFNPDSGFVGTTVTITGSDFDAVPSNNVVRFNGVAATVATASATSLAVKVPAGATSGPISITTPGGTTTSVQSFTVNPPPSISSLSPGSGTIGAAVTITGINFNAITPSDNKVFFNGTASIISAVTATTVTTIVPLGATTGSVTITNSGGTVASATPFAVTSRYDYSIKVSPAQTTVIQGKSSTYQVQINSTALESLTGFVHLSATGLPTGVTATFAPPQISGGQVSTLTLTTSAATTAGTFAMTVSGSASLEGKTVLREATLQLVVVASGGTTLVGRILAAKDDAPITGAKIKLGALIATTDESGNFILYNPPIGSQVILIDGPTLIYPANLPVLVQIASGAANDLPYPIYLQELSQRFTPIDPTRETIVTDPAIPDFEMHIPAGAQIIGWDGQPNTKVSVTPVALDRIPVKPIPPHVNTKTAYLFSFGKAGGGRPNRPIPVIYPNDLGAPPGERINLWYYDEEPTPDPNSHQWKIYGQGTVSQDGKRIIPDPGVGMPKFCCGITMADWQRRYRDNPCPSEDCDEEGDPVAPATGIFILEKTDAVLPGILPVVIKRTYRTGDIGAGAFGTGTGFNYDLRIRETGTQAIEYVLPDGGQYTLSQQPDGSFTNSSFAFLSGVRAYRLSDGSTKVYLKNGNSNLFNRAGYLVEQQDRNGNKITIVRDADNDIVEIREPSGRALIFTHQSFTISRPATFPDIPEWILPTTLKVITSITDPLGRVVSYSYDSAANLISVTDPAGGVTTYTYDADFRMTSITDARGITYLTNVYDANGRVIQQTQADGSTFRFDYMVAGQTVTQTTVTDPNGNSTAYRFNGRGYLMRAVDPFGQITRIERDFGTNQVMAIYDPFNRKRSFTYDLNGNRTSVVDPAGNTTLMEYEPTSNRLTKFTDALQNITRLVYDPNGNLIETTDPLGNSTHIAYNTTGQPTTITDALGNVTQFEYDDLGNLITTTDPLGNKKRRVYDTVSRLVSVTDPVGKTTSYIYDALNRIAQITDAIPGLTQFSYDPNGNLLTVTDAKNQTTTYAYDVMDRLATRTDPLNRSESYLYDPNGNLKNFTDRKGQVTAFTYDRLDRKINSTFADGSSVVFSYDGMKRLSKVTDSISGTIEFQYDSLLDRLTHEITPQGVVEYTYDAMRRRSMMMINGGQPVSYDYDANSRPTQIAQGTQVVGLGYDTVGRRTTLIYPNGVTTNYGYDAASRLANIAYQGPTAVIESLTYSYDAAGNRIGLTRANGATTLLPDSVQAAYDAANEQIRFNNSTPNLTYDANGSLISQTDTNGTTTYIWDARNRLIGINSPTVSANFVYDPLGRRVSKTIDGTKTDYQYDGNDIVSEIRGQTVGATYLRSLAIDEPFVRQGSTNEYYHADALRSVLVLTDQASSAQITYAYDAFGKTTVTGSSNNPFTFTGRENDGTELYYYRARYYSPQIHRFISEDPLHSPLLQQSPRSKCRTDYAPRINWYLELDQNLPLTLGVNAISGLGPNPQRIPLYTYVENDPLDKVDSMGLIAGPQTPGCDWFPDFNTCTTDCCNMHDTCYEIANGWCDWTTHDFIPLPRIDLSEDTSWWNNFGCDKCNRDVYKCLWNAATSSSVNGRKCK